MFEYFMVYDEVEEFLVIEEVEIEVVLFLVILKNLVWVYFNFVLWKWFIIVVFVGVGLVVIFYLSI